MAKVYFNVAPTNSRDSKQMVHFERNDKSRNVKQINFQDLEMHI